MSREERVLTDGCRPRHRLPACAVSARAEGEHDVHQGRRLWAGGLSFREPFSIPARTAAGTHPLFFCRFRQDRH
jgi:hypothetical protein